MKRVRPTALCAACAALLLAGCSSQDAPAGPDAADLGLGTDSGGESGCLFFCPDDAPTDAPLAVLVRGRIDQTCFNSAEGCHGGGAPMALSPGHEFDTMIDVRSTELPALLRVAPGDPLHSYVYLKVWCDGGLAPDSSCMPLGQTPSPTLAQLFYDWIEAGAPTP
jgi:hypothetical protein